MRGIFNLHPPSKTRPPVWDVEQLLKHMDSWGSPHDLSVEQAARRALLLLLLTTAARVGELADLVYPPLVRGQFSWEFERGRGLTKTSRQGHHSPTVTVTAFPPNALRCPVTALNAYAKLTEPHRPGQHNRLFLTLTRPYHAAAKDTLARWVKSTLTQAGIDVTTFTAHSTRAASTTAAHLKGVELADILTAAQWSRAATFHAHYFRPPQPSALSAAVLGNLL